MDTSGKYVKMCSEATEIQNYKNELDKGDFYIDRGNIEINCPQLTDMFPIPIDKALNIFWLPRQDQLQEMIEKEGKVVNKLITLIHRFYCENEIDYDSMEQLWLAFVMKEKYNKMWDENCQNWININKSKI